ncbi:MAG TPA: PIG-L deacetylase family protein [Candidatus Parcubacteria bacterium]|jgi:LmbE family N-acetylglucosaminyl deacetylase|nr:LmbE family protein [Parcubacteria group bacterium]HJN62266.1 PIG-L deacetylase family protein [Candidatus Parcubacteria bacterium]|tara:strand:+ start:55882 stop:56520 length:639 start_codon:yes stop_codon:yes gene_type:complete
MFNNVQKILVLAPHTDDAEIGCGGTITKFIEEGKEVFLANFSKAPILKESSLSPDILLEELKESAKVLEIDSQHLLIYDYPVRNLTEHRQEILEEMLKLRDKIKPDLVFMPTLGDIHQDHQVIAKEGLRAFKRTTILCYEDPWGHLTFSTVGFILLEEKNIEKKIAAIKKYKSQEHRLYMDEKFIRSLAKVRGVQIGASYAEAFEVVRLIIK